MILLFIIIGIIKSNAPGTLSCITYLSEQLCEEPGYCIWNGTTCQEYTQNQDCYRINEVGACRENGIYSSIGGSGLCEPLIKLENDYKNVCGITNIVDYNYVRYPIITTGFSTHSLAGQTVAQLKMSAPQQNFIYQVLSVNIQIAKNPDLQIILDLYKTYEAELVKVYIHPYQIEKALIQTLQNLRDDTTSLSPVDKQATMTKFWTLVDVYLKRLQIHKKNYQSYNYFLNFLQGSFSRLFLTIKGQGHMITISWSKYKKNGIIQIISYSPKLVGILNALSDIIFVNVLGEDKTSFTDIENMKISYLQESGTLTNVVRKLKFISDKTQIPHQLMTYTINSAICNSNERECEFSLPSPLSNSTFVFYVEQ
ncbi:unnamed protein product [Paramecium primaurelia]|uniref:Uncharacterized protein n=1 Tax=Paramecium primaurelia TaxID=5886 RepID=A0A8S1P5A6_PARPR|nr:unnamed protein product [Paramecium primaurelia]